MNVNDKTTAMTIRFGMDLLSISASASHFNREASDSIGTLQSGKDATADMSHLLLHNIKNTKDSKNKHITLGLIKNVYF